MKMNELFRLKVWMDIFRYCMFLSSCECVCLFVYDRNRFMYCKVDINMSGGVSCCTVIFLVFVVPPIASGRRRRSARQGCVGCHCHCRVMMPHQR